MFLADMETHTPNPAERFDIIRAELRLRFEASGTRHGIAGLLDVLILRLFMSLISVFASLAERRARQQNCQDGAGVEPGNGGEVGDFAADRSGDADPPDAGRRVAVRTAVAAAGGKLVCDDGTDDGCIRDEGGARSVRTTACGREPYRDGCGRAWFGLRTAGFEGSIHKNWVEGVGANCVYFVTVS